MLEEQQRRKRVRRALDDEIVFLESHRRWLENLANQHLARIFPLRPNAGVIIRRLMHRLLARKNGGQRSSLSSGPNRLLILQFAGIVFYPLVAERGNQRRVAIGTNVHDEFSP